MRSPRLCRCPLKRQDVRGESAHRHGHASDDDRRGVDLVVSPSRCARVAAVPGRAIPGTGLQRVHSAKGVSEGRRGLVPLTWFCMRASMLVASIGLAK
jgi:hypothetical protein